MGHEFIPSEYGVFGLILVAAVCVATVFLVWPAIWRTLSTIGIYTENQQTALVCFLAVLLSPFWLIIVYNLLQTLLKFAMGFKPAVGANATLLHSATLAILVAAFVLVLVPPFLLAKFLMRSRQIKTMQNAQAKQDKQQIADRFHQAVTQLGATRTTHKRAPRPIYQTTRSGNYITDKDGFPLPQVTKHGKTIAQWESWTETEPNIETRLGALFALERISQLSDDEHIAVMETICAYIRENAVSVIDVEIAEGMPVQYDPPRSDIQLAIKILGRRSMDKIILESQQDPAYRLDLRAADLAVVDFSSGTFGPARLDRANLHGAWMDNSSFENADFSSANMPECWLENAKLTNARLDQADLSRAWMVKTNLSGAEMNNVSLEGTKLIKSNLSGANLDGAITNHTDIAGANLQLTWLRGVDCNNLYNLTQNQIDTAFGDATTVLPDDFKTPLWPRQKLPYAASFQLWLDAQKQNRLT